MDADALLRKSWILLKENYTFISLGVLISLLLTLAVLYLGAVLLGSDLVMGMLVSTLLLTSIYLTTRYALRPFRVMDGLVLGSRFILAFAVFVLIIAGAYVLPQPLKLWVVLIIVSTLYMSIPIVAELGFGDGLRKTVQLLKRRPASVIGLNLFYIILMVALLSLMINIPMIILTILLFSFLYLPLYSITGYLMARWGPPIE